MQLQRALRKIFEGDELNKEKMSYFIKSTIRENSDKDLTYIKTSINEFKETLLKNLIQVRKLSDGRMSAYVNRSELVYLIENLSKKGENLNCCQKNN